MPDPRLIAASGEAPDAGALAAYDEILAGLARNEGWFLPMLAEAEAPISSLRHKPLFVHHLPRESRFVGRAKELAVLEEMYAPGRTGMIAVVGIGGAGKSVLIDRFLHGLRDADRLLVWSFY